MAFAQSDDKTILTEFRQSAGSGGNAAKGKEIFESSAASCAKCHSIIGSERRAGPNLSGIADKYSRDQLIRSVLEPNATVHPDYGTILATGRDGRSYTGVLYKRTNKELQLLNAEGKLVQLPVDEIDTERRVPTSLMPSDLPKVLSKQQFADLIAYLEILKQPADAFLAGMPDEIPRIEKSVRLEPIHGDDMRFDHPVWVVAIPGSKRDVLVVEQKTRQIWRLETGEQPKKTLFADFSEEATTGEFEGVVCLAFHPRFLENRKYYVNYHVRNQGSFFSPVIVERQATADFRRDAGLPSKRILQIHQDTDLHWGGMLAFGPDGYLYIGAGDAGPQEDPDGHSQNLNMLAGSILRIDVDRTDGDRPYAIPESNPFRTKDGIRPEIWASGYRMPWRFSFDPVTQDLWVGDIGQYLFEEVSICRVGENHGWNVVEGFMKFSDRFIREEEQYTPPVFAYRRKYGVSVTGGYVYRGKRHPSWNGIYIFGDFESKRIWGLTQANRQLIRVCQIGESPQRISSFGLDADDELLLVGYDGTISRVRLDDTNFREQRTFSLNVKLRRGESEAAARVAIVGSDGKRYAPSGALLRKADSSFGEFGAGYFYADGEFTVKLPVARAELIVDAGIENRQQTISMNAELQSEVIVQLQPWIDLNTRGWYSGDSHVHLRTGGPIQATVEDALLAARAEGLNFVNLCASNNLGNDLRDAEMITGKPHPLSTDRHLLVFGEEMRSSIYGHMQLMGIHTLVQPQYTGFDNTPNQFDFPGNYSMAANVVRQGGVVSYSHPMFTNKPFPFDPMLEAPNGAARELPIDAMLGVVHAIDLMSYNSDENESARLWYRLLNCGLRLSACAGTDALLDRSTLPLGGARVYVKTDGPLSMQSWIEGLKAGRTFVTNGPVPFITVQGKGPGETVRLTKAGKVRVSVNVSSLSPIERIVVVSNAREIASHSFDPAVGAPEDSQLVRRSREEGGIQTAELEFETSVERSGWIAVRVEGAAVEPRVNQGSKLGIKASVGRLWAHTNPVYVMVGEEPISSQSDAAFFVDWIEQLLRVVAVRNRYATSEDRRQVEETFRRAQDRFREMAK